MFPKEFLERMEKMLGGEYGNFLESLAQDRCQALRLNPSKVRVDGKNALQVLGEEKEEQEEITAAWKPFLSRVPWEETGYYYQAEDAPGKHPYHEAGVYYIQEPSAMVPAALLDAKPGERILDLCAAPGGKSTQIAIRMEGSGILFSNEINPMRAKALSENIERMGIGNACVVNETPEHLAEVFPEYFDRILVDAPCSGEGMFRKNQEACEEWSQENVKMCAGRQDGILELAAGMLRPGGRMVYSTCTFAPEENEGSVSRFLRKHKDFELVEISALEKERYGLQGCDGEGRFVGEAVKGLEGTIRLWPHRIQGEGHFAAVMRKAGAAAKEEEAAEQPVEQKENNSHKTKERKEALNTAAGGKMEGILRRVPEEFAAFVRENLKVPVEEAQVPAGEDLQVSVKEKLKMPVVEEKKSCDKKILRGSSGQTEMEDMLYALGTMTGRKGALQLAGFGEQLYLVSGGMPSLKGLRVLRPGLHLGEVKKNRFEPSHALALALRPFSALHRWDLKSDGKDILSYLNGGTLEADGEKGWYLICVDGFGIGWGKLAGGIMKNHYPKGLRGKGR